MFRRANDPPRIKSSVKYGRELRGRPHLGTSINQYGGHSEAPRFPAGRGISRVRFEAIDRMRTRTAASAGRGTTKSSLQSRPNIVGAISFRVTSSKLIALHAQKALPLRSIPAKLEWSTFPAKSSSQARSRSQRLRTPEAQSPKSAAEKSQGRSAGSCAAGGNHGGEADCRSDSDVPSPAAFAR